MEGCRRNPPKVLSVGCCDQPTLFHKVIIPAAVGDETTDPPLPGKYRNVLLVYETTENAYLYSSDGIPTLVSDKGELKRLEKLIKEEEVARKEEDEKLATAIEDEAKAREDADDALDDAILDETDARIEADEDIWTEIRTIEAASDVVDVVGTYAELEAYDTSKLHDNDLIKVLQDETHGDAITYYRWSTTTETFSYVGEQGPYYTQEQTNTLLDEKQNVLTAGDNITISSDVISAVDTTYTAGTGLTLTGTEFAVDTTVIAEKSDIPTQTSDLTNDGSDGTSTYVEADELATVATSGDYSDLINTPTIPTVNDATLTIAQGGTTLGTFTANSNTDTTIDIVAASYTAGTGIDITNSVISVDNTVAMVSDIPTATSDLTNDSGFITSADLPTKTSDLANDGADGTSTYVEADELATVATSGSYTDLINTPTIPAAQVNSDWNASSGVAEILNKPTIPTATSDLTNDSGFITSADLPTKTSDLTNDGSDGTSVYVESDELATVATTGSYTDLTNTPTIPAAQVNSDWNASSGVAEILNKPTLATVATTGAYSDLTGTPTIPTVNDATLTITQNGTSAGTFTANSATNTTIALTDTTYSAFTGTDGQAAGSAGLVPAPATTDAGKFLKADGTWGTITATTTVFYSSVNFEGWDDGTQWQIYLYADSAMTTYATGDDIYNAFQNGDVVIRYYDTHNAYTAYYSVDHVTKYDSTGMVDIYLVSGNWQACSSCGFDILDVRKYTSNNFWSIHKVYKLQEKLAAGSNITISGSTISATDTTYSVMTGATSSTAGVSGLVPAPAAGDEAKVLSGAGTWVNQSGGGVSTVIYYANSTSTAGFQSGTINGPYIYKDVARTTIATPGEIYDNFQAGNSIHIEYESTQTGTSAFAMTLEVATMSLNGSDTYSMVVNEVNEENPGDLRDLVMLRLYTNWDGQSTFTGRWMQQRKYVHTVNDGTLTIQHNGTTKGTFTANQSTASTVNIKTIYADTISPATAVAPITTGMIADGAVTAAKTAFGGNYSTSEVNTGFTWVDGKPIYKKTVSMGALPAGGATKKADVSSLQIETLVELRGMGWNPNNGNFRPLPFVGDNMDNMLRVDVNEDNGSQVVRIISTAGGSWDNYSESYVTLWYTKSS